MAHGAQIRVDLADPMPAYRQIVDQLRVLIVEGVLEVGQSLPPVRPLAVELGVHFNTVAEAYRTLAQEGLIETSHGRVARVAAHENRPVPVHEQSKSVSLFTQKLRQLVAESCARGTDKKLLATVLNTLAEELTR